MSTKNIHEAFLAEMNDLGENTTEFVIRPLYYGYGNTLGNSFRRVLLSSIKGAAITAFSIEGTNHEFSAIPGVREDLVDIMLNLKNIRFKSHTDSPVEAELTIKGSAQTEKDGDKRVVAGDIQLPSDVELGNPNQVICHIDDPNFTLKMHFVIETGRGYLTIDESGKNRIHSDMIALDAVFSPVLRVRYKVSNTRVGQDTNLQELALTVETDGTISTRDAFEEAAAILVNQYTALAGKTSVQSTSAPGTDQQQDQTLEGIIVEDLGLSARTTNALINNGIKTLGQLKNIPEAQLRELKGFGSKAYDEVQEKLTEFDK
ncbi:DNA-directed RNA polymerase subunit alpha [Candidatus Saccharibacteria bacterium]|nr:DNA-directed RNA polymerase subunit alpha [Candidatus Saccharibacteria bacterium]